VHTTSALSPERRPLIVLCVIAALLLMYATLWPFNPLPANGVSWLPDASAIRFQHSGVVVSSEPLKAPATQPTGDTCAIELYLRPYDNDEAGNVLTFSSDDNPDAVFLRQWRDSLIIYRSRPVHGRGPKLTAYEVDHVLHAGMLAFITITSGPQGTTIYIDGKVAGTTTRFRVPRSELYRQLVLGNSPSEYQVWHGEIHGLNIYDDEITPAEAAARFEEWSAASPSESTTTSSSGNPTHLLARYAFRERGGNIIHSDVASAPLLTIPPHFFIRYKALLASPVSEFDWTPNYRADIYSNILGFMPFGFVLCGLFALSRSRGNAILLATLVGGLLSFSVEFLQYYIPRRDSSCTDVISNTVGSLLGALIAYPALVRFALRLVFLLPSKRESEANQG
jgi:VanZ family protein